MAHVNTTIESGTRWCRRQSTWVSSGGAASAFSSLAVDLTLAHALQLGTRRPERQLASPARSALLGPGGRGGGFGELARCPGRKARVGLTISNFLDDRDVRPAAAAPEDQFRGQRLGAHLLGVACDNQASKLPGWAGHVTEGTGVSDGANARPIAVAVFSEG